MNRSISLLPLLALTLTLFGGCDDGNRQYRPCPLGVDPASFDCVPTYAPGAFVALDVDASELPELDVTPIPPDVTPFPSDTSPDISPGDGGCIPQCGGRECGFDGCGGSCGTCPDGLSCDGPGICVPGLPEQLTCSEVIECIQNCFNEDCAQQCLDNGTPQAQEGVFNIYGCIEELCWEFQDDEEAMARCQRDECGWAFDECLDGTGSGGATCGEALECITTCDLEDQRCLERCYEQATFTAQADLQDLFDCGSDRCGNVGSTGEWYDCVGERCNEEFNACYEIDIPPPFGACNEQDFEILESVGEDALWVIADCGFSCSGQRNADECASSCNQQFGVNPACTTCLGDLSLCMAEECGRRCEDPQSDACSVCVDSACLESFDNCAGSQP